ncbi:MAG TPA: hypothetical protein VKU79_04980 [Thermoplasmataceae archaeon]|nr:hypothetical protein [Thermoplasmataceae archaeon]
MVPVLVVMSGALAFSAFSGSITTNVNASAGYISFNQQAWLYNYSASNTVMTVDNMPLAIPSPASFTPMSLGWAGLDNSGNVTEQTVNVGNMAPGNFVTFEFEVTNNGSVGFVLSSATPTTAVSGGLGSVDATSWSVFKEDMSSTGYVYMVTSIPSGSIDNGHTASYFVVVGLASGSDNSYEESTFALTITVTVTSDA